MGYHTPEQEDYKRCPNGHSKNISWTHWPETPDEYHCNTCGVSWPAKKEAKQ